MTANWFPIENSVGIQGITVTSATQNHALGKLVRAKDHTTSGQGEGEFIYLLGVASTVAGDVVRYNATTFQTTRFVAAANTATPLAVAMSANVAAQYGWYQISGYTVINKVTGVTVNPNVNVFATATAGSITATAASGKQILGARSANLTTVASATTTVAVMLDRPHGQGAVS